MKKLLSGILLIVICFSVSAQPFKAIREVNFKRAYIDSLIWVDYLASTSTRYSIVVYDSASKTLRQVPASTFSTGCGDSTGGGGTGSVTSVGISSTDLTVTGTNPIVSSGTFTLTLPTVNAHPGTFGNSHKIPIITANAKGLVTNLDSVDISIVDTTLFPAYIDSTTQAYQRILVAGRDGKISSDSMFLYNFAQNKVVINAKTSAKFGSAIKLYVNGGAVFNGIIAREGGKSNQFLKADGSIDTTHYVKSVSVNGTTYNVDTTTGNVDLGTISAGSSGTVTSVGLTSTDFDITGSPITSAGTFTANLKTVNSNIGTFNNLQVNAKGQVTAASNVSYLTSFTETDPIYTSLGVSLAGQQTLTGVKTFPASTVSNPSFVVPSGSAYTGTTTGATWVNSNHIWTYLNGTATQLDNQVTAANAILNQTSLQSSANFNIDGAGKVGSLAFNTLPTNGSVTTDSVLTVNTSGAVRRVDAASLSPFFRGNLPAMSASKNYVQLRNNADTLYIGSNNVAFAKTNIYGNTNIAGALSLGFLSPSTGYQLTVDGKSLFGGILSTTNSYWLFNPFFNATSGQTIVGIDAHVLQSQINTSTYSGAEIIFQARPSITGTGIAKVDLYKGYIESGNSVTGYADTAYIFHASAEGGHKTANVFYQYKADSVSTTNSTVYGFVQAGTNGINQFDGQTTTHYTSMSAAPTTADIPNGYFRMIKNTTSGELRLYSNDGGTIKSVLLN